MTSKEKIKNETVACLKEAIPIIEFLQKGDTTKTYSFHMEYQKWYSKALKIIEILSADRYSEFKSYYEIDPKRKSLGYGTYVIQDYIKGVKPSQYSGFDTKEQALKNLFNQYTILVSVNDRIDSVLADIQTTLLIELQDTELETAKSLLKVNLRSSGIIAGIVLESYLSSVVDNHQLTLSKRNPTLSDFNETLKNNNTYDTTIWRKISYLADIRNICAHNKNVEPKKEQIEELIDGVHWVTKNVF